MTKESALDNKNSLIYNLIYKYRQHADRVADVGEMSSLTR